MKHPLPHANVPIVPGNWHQFPDPADWPWPELPPLRPFLLAEGSGPAREQTTVRLCHDGSMLYVHFSCEDSDIWGTYTERDEPIYDEEVVELFIAPGLVDPVDYLELEVSPNGVLLDVRIHNPTGLRADMTADFAWDCPGIRWHAQRDDANNRWQAMLAMPLVELAGSDKMPSQWRANFYRIERPRDGADEFSCWSPVLVEPADFHTPSRFGTLELVGLSR